MCSNYRNISGKFIQGVDVISGRMKYEIDIYIGGIDEAGRGPLAGPVTAACVVFPKGYTNTQINDSKKLSEEKRKILAPQIKNDALAWSVVAVGHRRVDALNIRNATNLAMRLAAIRVIRKLESPVHFLVDGNMRILEIESQETIIKGDEKEVTIGAASILAKTYRDHLMELLAKKYLHYGLEIHKGYPTKKHKELIGHFGPCNIHRRTFSGVKEYL